MKKKTILVCPNADTQSHSGDDDGSYHIVQDTTQYWDNATQTWDTSDMGCGPYYCAHCGYETGDIRDFTAATDDTTDYLVVIEETVRYEMPITVPSGHSNEVVEDWATNRFTNIGDDERKKYMVAVNPRIVEVGAPD